jgi:NAD(P)-dependent dehydrogenase (short-subunit alcohol dehydrogenase family)
MTVLARFQLDDKVVIVAEATSTLGFIVAKGLAEAGANVVVSGRTHAELDATLAKLQAAGHQASDFVADVGTPEGCDSLVENVMQAHGRLDGMLNIASGLSESSAEALAPCGRFQAQMNSILLPALLLSQSAAKVMSAGGSIVQVLSMSSTAGAPDHAGRAASEGVLGLTRDLANEWRDQGIRVNAIVARHAERPDTSSISEADVAVAAVFLASDGSSYLSGIGLPISNS